MLDNFNGKQFLNIIHLNIRSLRKNIDQLLVYIESINTNNIDVMVLSETWILEGVSDFSIPNFNMYYSESHFNQNDGIAVYVKNNIDTVLDVIQLSETKLLRFSFTSNNNISYALTASYRPPSTNVNLYTTELENYFLNIQKGCVEIFIGDININILNANDPNVNSYICMLAQLGFFSYVNKPTRETETTSTLIDHIFIRLNNTNLLKSIDLKSYIFQINITDHYMLLLSINEKLITSNNNNSNDDLRESKSYKCINYNSLNNMLSTETWDDVLQIKNSEDAYNKFLEKLYNYIDLNSKTYTSRTPKTTKLKPWITQGLINSIRYRDLLKRKLNKTYSVELDNNYKKYRNFLNNLIKKTKNDFYKAKIESAQKNYKKIWHVVNDITNGSKNNNNQINNIVDNNATPISDDKQKANYLNNFFVSMGNEMAKTIRRQLRTYNK